MLSLCVTSIFCCNISVLFFQTNLQQLAQQIEQLNPPEIIFHSVVENAVLLSGSGSSSEELVDELWGDEGLANVSVQML